MGNCYSSRRHLSSPRKLVAVLDMEINNVNGIL